MKFIKILPSQSEPKIIVEVFPNRSMIFMISSSGISYHPDEEHIQKCLSIYGSFKGYMDVTRGALDLAYELIKLELPEYISLKILKCIETWEIEKDRYGYMDDEKAPILERLKCMESSEFYNRDNDLIIAESEEKRFMKNFESEFTNHIKCGLYDEIRVKTKYDTLRHFNEGNSNSKRDSFGKYQKRKFR